MPIRVPDTNALLGLRLGSAAAVADKMGVKGGGGGAPGSFSTITGGAGTGGTIGTGSSDTGTVDTGTGGTGTGDTGTGGTDTTSGTSIEGTGPIGGARP